MVITNSPGTMRFSSILVLLFFITQVAFAGEQYTETTVEGLILVPNTKMATVFLGEGVDFGVYNKVYLEDCHVAFRRNWQRDQNKSSVTRVRDKDIAKIKNSLAKECKETFSKQLAETGTTVVDELDSDVLIVRPAIVNLDVIAPDTMKPGVRSFTTSAGSMTLYLEAFDGITGDMLAMVIDPKKASDYGSFRVTNGVSNRNQARQILNRWAKQLAEYLQTARESASSPE